VSLAPGLLKGSSFDGSTRPSIYRLLEQRAGDAGEPCVGAERPPESFPSRPEPSRSSPLIFTSAELGNQQSRIKPHGVMPVWLFAFRAGHGGDPCAGQNRPALTAPATPGQASHGRKAEAGVPRLTLIWRLLKSDAALTCNTCLFKRIHFVISQRELVRWLLVACLRRHRPDEHDRRYQLGGISAAPTSR
jgi:hypothetical protein